MKKKKLWLILAGFLVIVALLGGGIFVTVRCLNDKRAVKENPLTQDAGEVRSKAALTKEQVTEFKDVYLVDYMILANDYSGCDGTKPDIEREGAYAPPEIIQGFELCDIDSDGIQELLVESVETNSEMARPTLSTFDSEQSIFSVWTDESAAGGISFQTEEDTNNVYICKYYATDYFYVSYHMWSEEGWREDSVFEKEGDMVTRCQWQGQEVSEEVWLESDNALNDRVVTNKLQDYTKLHSEATAKVTAETIYSYYKDILGLNAFLLQPDEAGTVYYVILDSYTQNRWKNQMNSDKANGREMFTYQEGFDSSDIMLVIQADGKESEISCMFFPDWYDILQASYDNGIIIEDAQNSYVYEINNNELEYIRKLYMSDVENKLVSAKWYTMSTTNERVIYEYEFLENGTILQKEYHDVNGNWELQADTVSQYFYTYDSDSKDLFVSYGQDGKQYRFDDTYQAFIELPGEYYDFDYLGDYNRDGYYRIYQKCLVQYSEFPEYDALFQACDALMRSYYVSQTEEMTETSKEVPAASDNNIESGMITPEQAYNAVVNYCYSVNPDLASIINEGYMCYWTAGDLEGEEYIITYRSYTGAFIYYHVNAYSGSVYSTEYVPGITDGEVQGNEVFSVYDYL